MHVFFFSVLLFLHSGLYVLVTSIYRYLSSLQAFKVLMGALDFVKS